MGGLSDFSTDLLTNGIVSQTDRTSWFSEGSVYNVMSPTIATPSVVSGSASMTVSYDINNGAYCIIGDELVTITGNS